MSPILQNQTFCGKGNDDTKGKKFKVSGSHDTSEISIKQHLGKIPVHPDWISGLDYQHGMLQILSTADGCSCCWWGVLHTHTKQEETS